MQGKRFRFPLALMLALCGVVLALAACGGGNGEEDEQLMSAEAENVSYEPSGAYTTTLTIRDGVSIEGLTAEDLQVGYQIPELTEEVGDSGDASTDSQPAAPDASTETIADDTDANEVPKADSPTEAPADEVEQGEAELTVEDIDGKVEGEGEVAAKDVIADVTEFTVNDDGTATLSFEDTDASEYLPLIYNVSADAAEEGSDPFYTEVCVDYPTFTLKPDVEYVSATSEATKLTLELEEGEFASDVAKEDVTLSGAFANMGIESLSCAGKNLTLQLTGTPVRTDAAGVYLDGSVGVAPKAIQHASAETRASIPVHVDGAYFKVAELAVQDGAVTAPLTIYGLDDIAGVKASDVSFSGEGVTVRDVAADGQTTLKLTLEVPDVKDANEAAAKLNGQTVKVRDRSFTAEYPVADFYPVFDYVEESDGNLELTLIAYANSGTFAEDLSADQVTLADGFKDGKVESIERTGDTTAEIKLTIPANGMTAEDIDVNGTVTLAAGVLVNAWGEPGSGEASFTRTYSEESLGRDEDGIESLTQFFKLIQGSPVPTFLSTLGSFGSAYNSINTMLTLLGVKEDANAEIESTLNQINSKIDSVKQMLVGQAAIMAQINQTLYEDRIGTFVTTLNRLEDENNDLHDFYERASTLGVPEPSESYASMTATDAGAEGNPYVGMDVDAQTKLYYTLLLQAMTEQDKVGGAFDGFVKTMDAQEADYRAVADAVSTTYDPNNALYNYDYLCSLTYNFDGIANPYRNAFRAQIAKELEEGLPYICMRYNDSSKLYHDATTKYDAALDAINNTRAVVDPDDSVLMYIFNVQVYRDFKAVDDISQYAMFSNGTNEYAGKSYEPKEPAVVGYSNLNDTEQADFQKRLKGRTIYEELILAGFQNLDWAMTKPVSLTQLNGTSYDLDILGLCMRLSYNFEGRGSFRHDYKHFNADYIPWNSSSITKNYELARYSQGGGFLSDEGYTVHNGTVLHLMRK